MKSKWILTLTAAAVGMSMMLAGCGGKDTASDGSSTHSNLFRAFENGRHGNHAGNQRQFVEP